MAIDELKKNPNLGKPLQEDFVGYRSHRFKRYRVIYKYHERQNQINVIFAGNRLDVYEQFSKYLKRSTIARH